MNTALKKRAAAGLLSILTALALVLPAAAHHGGGRHGCRTAAQIPACTVENCAIEGRHFHNGVTYCGTYHANGVCTAGCYSQGVNLKVAACAVEGCTLTGRHLHDGVTYCGTSHADGCCTAACYASNAQTVPACTVEGCTLTGRHVHDGETYCGAHHAGGFCTTGCYGAHTSGGHWGHC